jgi:hypothetical protein
MKDKAFRKYIEPLIHALTGFVCVTVSVITLMSKMINPSVRRNWCAREMVPFWCDGNDEYNVDENYVLCVRGNIDSERTMLKRFFIFSGIAVVLIFISMVIIVITVYRLEKQPSAAAANQNSLVGSPSSRGNINSTKVISVQICAYLLSLTLFTTCTIVSGLDGPNDINVPTQIFFLVVGNTHGISNFCIFVGHKVYSLQRADQSLSFKSALWKVLVIRNETVFIFENVPESLESNRLESNRLESNREMSVRSTSENSNENQSQTFLNPDPIKPAHIITMFHLNASQDEKDNWSLPTKDKNPESINEDDLPSKNDLSSSLRYGDSEQHSLDFSDD